MKAIPGHRSALRFATVAAAVDEMLEDMGLGVAVGANEGVFIAGAVTSMGTAGEHKDILGARYTGDGTLLWTDLHDHPVAHGDVYGQGAPPQLLAPGPSSVSPVSTPTPMIRPALSTATPIAMSRLLAAPSCVYVHAIVSTGSPLLPALVVGTPALVPVDAPPPPSVLIPGDAGPQAVTKTSDTSNTRALDMFA